MGGLVQNISHEQTAEWLQNARRRSLEAFERQGLPTPKTEAWKYTKLRDFKADDYEIAREHTPRQKVEFPFPVYELEYVNGNLVTYGEALPEGMKLKPLSEAGEYLNRLADIENYPFAALNGSCLEQGFLLEIKPGARFDRPLVLTYFTRPEGRNLLENIRNIIVVGAGSEIDLIEYYHYAGEVKSRYLLNQVNEIFIAADAVVNHYKYQNEAFKANHIALHAVEQQAGSQYNAFCLQKGANIARNETKIRLLGREARARVDAAYLMNGWATIDTPTDIEHLEPETYSSQLVKGVVGGDAKGVFQGKIHIAPHAVKTEGTQLHKALLLSDSAEIDVKPELEIFADDVKCSHGAASGELDEEQLFYMQARGIGRDEAKQLLIDAYLEDVFCRIASEPIRCWLQGLK